MAGIPKDERRGSRWQRMGQRLVQVLSLFVILEPIWMLLPFAGFLYGSVFQIQTLARNPSTARLTHFVFPVLTLGLLGPVLAVVGFLLFMVGACQIYWAKLRKSGLVTRGMYRLARHPQYVSLTLFGVGILLTWGRAITFIAFFVMMLLYYYLAKSEERGCRRLFGEAYERYRERTSFILPGDRLLRPLAAKLPHLRLPAPLRVALAFAATLVVCFGLMWLIRTVKVAVRAVPYLTASIPLASAAAGEAAPTLPLAAGVAGGMPFVQAERVAVLRGPYRNAAAPGFAERLIRRLPASKALKGFLEFLDRPDGDAAIVFCAPFIQPDQPGTPGRPKEDAGDRRGPPPDPAGPDRVRLILFRCVLAPGATFAEALSDKAKREIHGGCIAPVNLARPEGEDIVEGEITRPGPGFPGEQRWDFLVGQFTAQGKATAPPTDAAPVPPPADRATLVLVEAPILRTRLDPAFAQSILDRLVASPRFRDHLGKSAVGGGVVAVAFPRPGPNWYRQHHGKPQVSVFVVLARLSPGADLDALFRPRERSLLGAFTAELDFRTEGPADSVGEIAPIGPRRDLEERWEFFLSGVGGERAGQ